MEQHGLRGTTWRQAGLSLVLLALAAPFFRYLCGVLLAETAGSVLAVALLHASFNASGSLSAVGGWQYIPAMVVLALIVAGYRGLPHRRGRTAIAATVSPAPSVAETSELGGAR